MDPEKRRRLEAHGWKVSDTVQEAFGLSDHDMKAIEQRISKMKINYEFTVKVSLRADSDESAYRSLIEQLRPLYGVAVETISCNANGKALSEHRFDKVRDSVLNGADD